MFKKPATRPARPPRPGVNSTPVQSASTFAVTSLLDQIGAREIGQQPDLANWKRFLTGTAKAPVRMELSDDPEIVGQALASFIRNNDRRRLARQHGRDHEIRSALGETVGALSQLVAEVSTVRTDANAVLNQIADYLESLSASEESKKKSEEALSQVRSIIRKLDVCANEKRRTVNSRLASVRMELLELPPESTNGFRTPRSSAAIEDYLRRYAEAARQLGESVTLVTIEASTASEHLNREDVLITVADAINDCFQREVDFVSRLERNRFVAILIDTPDAAVRALLSNLRSRIDDSFPGIYLTGSLHVDIVAVNPDSVSRGLEGLVDSEPRSDAPFESTLGSRQLNTFVSD